MELVGLKRKNALCKICNSFDEETLNDITLDILLKRRSYFEIIDNYSPKLPPHVAKLNQVNINNHRKHSDPALLADSILRKQNIPTSKGAIISRLFGEMYKEKVDSVKILKQVYKERLSNLYSLQFILDEKKFEYTQCQQKTDVLSDIKKRNLLRDIRGLVKEIDSIHSDLQNVVIKELNSEKGIGEGNTQVTQNFTFIMQDKLKAFLDDFIPFLFTMFQSDTGKAREIIKVLTSSMDSHLQLEKVLGDSTTSYTSQNIPS